jgi:putative FmdB family regulatory protein
MPLYEYFCSSCQETFESLRPAQQADKPAQCPACQSQSAQRVLSLVASSVLKTNGANAPSPAMMAPSVGGCCGGACGCHH